MAGKALGVQRGFQLQLKALSFHLRNGSRPGALPGPDKSGTDRRADLDSVAAYRSTGPGEP